MKYNFFKIASLLMAAVMLFSCGDVTPENTGGENIENGGGAGEQPDDFTKDLVLVADKTIIHANGADAVTFTVSLGSKVLKEDVVFSDKDGEIINSITDFKFTTTQVGEYMIRAEYKTKMSALVKIQAMPMAIPETPVDPQPSSVNFRRKILISYFTGTGCPNCPRVKDELKKLGEMEGYPEKYVTAVCHSYNDEDPAYFEGSLPMSLGVAYYPSININLTPSTTNSGATAATMKTSIDSELEDDVLAGISANAVYKDGKVIVKAAVKVVKTGKYRVGAWLLEDGIEGRQSGGTQPYHHIHDQSLRIADSKVSSTDWSGYSLGTLAAGSTAEHVFTMTMKDGWVAENCHVIVFVSTPSGNNYYVNNVIDVDLNSSVQFDYVK